MLDGLYAARREAAAVADALDVVDNGPRRIASQQEVAVQRMYGAFRLDGARRSDERAR